MNIAKLRLRLDRLIEQRDRIQSAHAGKELTTYNYHAGWNLGYVNGKITEIETLLDELNEIYFMDVSN